MTPREGQLRRQTRQASIVIAVAMLGWLAVTALGGALGLPVRFAFLADLLCLAALAWAGIVLFKVWRERRS